MTNITNVNISLFLSYFIERGFNTDSCHLFRFDMGNLAHHFFFVYILVKKSEPDDLYIQTIGELIYIIKILVNKKNLDKH